MRAAAAFTCGARDSARWAGRPRHGARPAAVVGVSDTTALAALKCLATTGVVSRLKASNQTLHVLDHLHVARGVVLALADLPDTLVERVATAAGAGRPRLTASPCGCRRRTTSTCAAATCWISS